MNNILKLYLFFSFKQNKDKTCYISFQAFFFIKSPFMLDSQDYLKKVPKGASMYSIDCPDFIILLNRIKHDRKFIWPKRVQLIYTKRRFTN